MNFDLKNEIDERLNTMPQDSPWYIEDMLDVSEEFEPYSSRHECRRMKFSDHRSELYKQYKKRINKDDQKAVEKMRRAYGIKSVKRGFANIEDNLLSEY